jgi:hypothetical protein
VLSGIVANFFKSCLLSQVSNARTYLFPRPAFLTLGWADRAGNPDAFAVDWHPSRPKIDTVGEFSGADAQ